MFYQHSHSFLVSKTGFAIATNHVGIRVLHRTTQEPRDLFFAVGNHGTAAFTLYTYESTDNNQLDAWDAATLMFTAPGSYTAASSLIVQPGGRVSGLIKWPLTNHDYLRLSVSASAPTGVLWIGHFGDNIEYRTQDATP